MFWRTRQAIFVLFEPVFRVERFRATYASALKEFNEWITRPLDYSQSVADCLNESMVRAGRTSMVSTYPAFVDFYYATACIKRLVDSSSSEQVTWADAVCGGYEDDMIVHMGLMIYDLSTLLRSSEFDDIEALETKIERRVLPQDFLARWDEFLQRYGCRRPLELELANPKYAETPRIVLQQIAGIAAAGCKFNPYDMQRTQIDQREQA